MSENRRRGERSLPAHPARGRRRPGSRGSGGRHSLPPSSSRRRPQTKATALKPVVPFHVLSRIACPALRGNTVTLRPSAGRWSPSHAARAARPAPHPPRPPACTDRPPRDPQSGSPGDTPPPGSTEPPHAPTGARASGRADGRARGPAHAHGRRVRFPAPTERLAPSPHPTPSTPKLRPPKTRTPREEETGSRLKPS